MYTCERADSMHLSRQTHLTRGQHLHNCTKRILGKNPFCAVIEGRGKWEEGNGKREMGRGKWEVALVPANEYLRRLMASYGKKGLALTRDHESPSLCGAAPPRETPRRRTA